MSNKLLELTHTQITLLRAAKCEDFPKILRDTSYFQELLFPIFHKTLTLEEIYAAVFEAWHGLILDPRYRLWISSNSACGMLFRQVRVFENILRVNVTSGESMDQYLLDVTNDLMDQIAKASLSWRSDKDLILSHV